MNNASGMRDKARRCQTLASIATDQYIIDELLRLAREFEREAVLADIRALSDEVHFIST
ncbi:MAG: hypothetical protein ACLQJR_31650 [Stellaceae bacterium]